MIEVRRTTKNVRSRLKNTDNPRKSALHNPSIHLLSRAAMSMSVKLSSSYAGRVFDGCVKRFADAAFKVDFMLYITGNPKANNATITSLSQILIQLQADLEQDRMYLTNLLNSNGVSVPSSFLEDMPIVTTEIYSPSAAKFINLIEDLDKVICLIETLELNGIFDKKHCDAACYAWQHRFVSVTGKFFSMANRAIPIVFGSR